MKYSFPKKVNSLKNQHLETSEIDNITIRN